MIDMNTMSAESSEETGLDQRERCMLIDFLLSHIEDKDGERFQEIDFTQTPGELVYKSPEGCQVMFRHIDQLLMMLKNAFIWGSRIVTPT